MRPKILVLGGSFAGLTAAFSLKRALKSRAEVTVLARQEQFVSILWKMRSGLVELP